MKNVVVIGGGTGLSAMMSGLKHLEDVIAHGRHHRSG